MNDWDLIDEGLIRAAGELPAVSRRLRRHVLRAAKKAERRRRLRRRMLLAASLLLPLILLGSWQRGVVTGRTDDDAAAHRASAIGLPDLDLPSTDSWGPVDASLQRREKQSRAIRSSLY